MSICSILSAIKSDWYFIRSIILKIVIRWYFIRLIFGKLISDWYLIRSKMLEYQWNGCLFVSTVGTYLPQLPKTSRVGWLCNPIMRRGHKWWQRNFSLLKNWSLFWKLYFVIVLAEQIEYFHFNQLNILNL